MKGKERNVPSVIVSATKNNANGGMPSRAFNVANTAERITYGARIFRICSRFQDQYIACRYLELKWWQCRERRETHEERSHEERIEDGYEAIYGFEVER